MNTNEKISFVIPCYRSEHTISAVLDEIDELMSKHTENEYEIVLVNDSSPDNVWSVIKGIAEKRKEVKAVSFTKNFGQHAALLSGYRVASGDLIVSLDDDGQSPVDRTFDLIDKIHEGYDVVYARYNKIQESLWRRWGSWLSNKMSEVLIGKPKDILESFCADGHAGRFRLQLRRLQPDPPSASILQGGDCHKRDFREALRVLEISCRDDRSHRFDQGNREE